MFAALPTVKRKYIQHYDNVGNYADILHRNQTTSRVLTMLRMAASAISKTKGN